MVALLALGGGFGCGGEGEEEEEEDATMSPGEPCMDCHFVESDSHGSEVPFTAAGTVFTDGDGAAPVEGATVVLNDAADGQVSMTTNSAGNFFTDQALSFPVSISITKGENSVDMLTTSAHGDCNSCHSAGNLISFPQ
jgi:hypothetical protein